MLIQTKIFNNYKKAYIKNLPQRDLLDVVVMLSAGIDSVALAHFVCTNKKFIAKLFTVKDVNVKLYHFNHKLRKQNDIMEQRAVELAEYLNTEINVCRATEDCTSEQKARIQRFKHFKDFKGVILTAHHMNDCVESYLMNVLRGHEDRQPIPFITKMSNAYIAHLLLFTEKEILKDYVTSYGLSKFVEEDETNTVIKGSRRNLIRQQLIPMLQQNDIVLNKTVYKKMETKLQKLYA